MAFIMDTTPTNNNTENLRKLAMQALVKAGNTLHYHKDNSADAFALMLTTGVYTRNMVAEECAFTIAHGYIHPATVRRIEAFERGMYPSGIALAWTAKTQAIFNEIRSVVKSLPGSVFIASQASDTTAYWIVGEEKDHIDAIKTCFSYLKNRGVDFHVTHQRRVKEIARVNTKKGRMSKVSGDTAKTVESTIEAPEMATQTTVSMAEHIDSLPTSPNPQSIEFLSDRFAIEGFSENLIREMLETYPFPVLHGYVPLDRGTKHIRDRIQSIPALITEGSPADINYQEAVIALGEDISELSEFLSEHRKPSAIAPVSPSFGPGLTPAQTMSLLAQYQADVAKFSEDVAKVESANINVSNCINSLHTWAEAVLKTGMPTLFTLVVQEDEARKLYEKEATLLAREEEILPKEGDSEVLADTTISSSTIAINRNVTQGNNGNVNTPVAYTMPRMEHALESPKRKPSFILDDNVSVTLSAIAYQLLTKGYCPHILMTGLPGTGKTETAKEFAANMGVINPNWKFLRINCPIIADAVQLFGRSGVRSTQNGPETYSRESLFTYAISRPQTVIALDEINRFEDAQIASALFAILDDSRSAWIESLDRTVAVADKVIFFGTRNRDGDAGTTGTSDALSSRFGLHIDTQMPDKDTLAQILSMVFSKPSEVTLKNQIDPHSIKPKGITTGQARQIAEVVTSLNSRFDKGELSLTLGIREAIHAVSMFAIGGAPTLRYTIANRYDAASVAGDSERMKVLTLLQTTFVGFSAKQSTGYVLDPIAVGLNHQATTRTSKSVNTGNIKGA